MKRFYNDEFGSISVYLLILIVPIFIFIFVFIDIARIQVAEKQSETAIKAAIRSTFSAYDQQLKRLGLFGLSLSSEEANKIFEEVYLKNLSSSIQSTSFQLINPVSSKGTSYFTPIYSLANHQLFNQQILEEMKYQAPIELALSIKDKFNQAGVSNSLREASYFAENAEKTENLIMKRDKQLDEAWKYLQQLYLSSEQNHIRITDDLQSLVELAKKMEIITTLHAREDESSLKKYASLSAQYLSLTLLVKINLSNQKNQLTQSQQNISTAVSNAKKTNQEIRELLKKTNPQQSTNQIISREVFKHTPVLPDDYFDSYQTSIGTIVSMSNRVPQLFESSVLISSKQNQNTFDAQEKFWSYFTSFYLEQMNKEKAREEKLNSIEQQKSIYKQQIQQTLDIAKQVTGECLSNRNQESDRRNYMRLEGSSNAKGIGYFQKYMEYNQQSAYTGNELTFELKKPEQVSLSSMKLLGMFADSLESARNEIYLNEFALSRFSYRTFDFDKEHSTMSKSNALRFDITKHSLQNQEIEYVLYGFSSCEANLATAYGEMFSFRLAIRTLEALMDPKKQVLQVGSPLLTLLAAVSEGVVIAHQDMNQLIDGKQVALTSVLNTKGFTLNYKDYLRMFLLMHSENRKSLSRMQALIELNTSKDLTKITAYAQGQTFIQLRLWFLPQFVKGLEKIGLSRCAINKTNCEITDTITWSY